MAAYPTVTNAAFPSSGPDGNAAAIASMLPSIASLIPGKFGGIFSALASIPGSVMSYNSTKAATDAENANRATAIDALNQWTPYTSRPAEFNTDVRVPYAADIVKVAKAGQEETNRAAEDARRQWGSGRYGMAAPAQIYSSVDNIRRAGEDQTQQTIQDIWQDAQVASINNKLQIGQAELQRNTGNSDLGSQRMQMLLSALTSPYGVTSPNGIMGTTEDRLRYAQNLQLEQDKIAAQKWMTYKQVQAQRLSAFTGLGGNIASAGIMGSALKGVGSSGAGTTSTMVPGSGYAASGASGPGEY